MGGKFRFNGGFEQTFVGIGSGFAYLMAAFVIASYELAFQTFDTRLIIRSDRDFQQSFRFCTADSQQTVGGAAFQRLGEVEVIPVFGSFILFAFHYFGDDLRLSSELVTHCVAGMFVFVHLFGDDVTGTF